ncbi:peptide chain release factor N(5)-glutamine methyltransferase [Myxococcota bacterium]|nr:peptide chain release factor N(5)-glutamine methyltransferase [Myxococcota bacterium]
MTKTVGEILQLSSKYLRDKGSESPRLDAELLIADALKIRRLDLYLSPERPLTVAETDCIREGLRRRAKLEPLAYIRGVREFFGLNFHVTPDTLIPRPETETLVDAAITWISANLATKVVDAGTGSGAIACTLAANLPQVHVLATDISKAALDVAARNADALDVTNRISFINCHLLDDIPKAFNPQLIISNPPYIAENERELMDISVLQYEPLGALFSGDEGTDLTFELIERAREILLPGGAFIVETGSPAQRDKVRARLESAFSHNVSPLTDPGGTIRGFLVEVSDSKEI